MDNKKLLIVAGLIGAGVYLITKSASTTPKQAVKSTTLLNPIQPQTAQKVGDTLQIIKK